MSNIKKATQVYPTLLLFSSNLRAVIDSIEPCQQEEKCLEGPWGHRKSKVPVHTVELISTAWENEDTAYCIRLFNYCALCNAQKQQHSYFIITYFERNEKIKVLGAFLL